MAGSFSMPRKLTLTNNEGIYQLTQRPIVADNIPTEEIILNAHDAITSNVATTSSNTYRLKLTINLLDSKGFALNLLQNDNEKSILSYDVATETLSFDRTQSGQVGFHPRFKSVETMTVKPQNKQLKLDIIVDKSVVEIFANNGRKVLTDLVFPTKTNGKVLMIWQ
ncbi:MAG: GH32 C-terminal domain-containing protein [Spirosomataceae bacterium]